MSRFPGETKNMETHRIRQNWRARLLVLLLVFSLHDAGRYARSEQPGPFRVPAGFVVEKGAGRPGPSDR